MPSIREAVFTVSPCTVYSSRRSEPTLPDMNGPLFEADPHADLLAEPVLAQPVVEARQADVDHLAGGRERAVGVVLDLDRRAEHRQEAVAAVGDERASVLEDRVARLVEVAVQGGDHELGRPSLGERREAAEIGEHDRADRAYAAEPQVVVGPGEDVVDDVLRAGTARRRRERARARGRGAASSPAPR